MIFADDSRPLRALLYLVSSLAFCFFTGCASRSIEVVSPVGTTPLASNEGFLIVQIDTDQAVDGAVASGLPLIGALPKGRHIWIARVPAGRYEWDSISLPAHAGKAGTLKLDHFKALRRNKNWVWDDEFQFDVTPGVINYPGELILRGDSHSRSAVSQRLVRNRNHAAMAIRKLQESHGDFLSKYRVQHSGPGEDGFLDYYSEQRDQAARRVTPRGATQ